jgi:hypothetical protein
VLAVRGISYLSDQVSADAVEGDLARIRHELGCTAVVIKGSDPPRQFAAAETALELGLDVWIEAQRENARPRAAVAHLDAVALWAEQLRVAHPGRVTLIVGNELSLLTRGLVPGPFLLARLALILRVGHRLRIDRRLDQRLAEARAVARRRFRGPITYSAALWEHPDWSGFDIVAVNLYRVGADAAGYAERVRRLVETAGKPVVITEFGCGAHRGADLRGPGSFQIVNWYAQPPRVKRGHVRDEGVQERYLLESLDVFEAAGVHGCFAFTYVMPTFPRDPDPALDLDMAGFGVVTAPGRERKAAFHALARRYAR